jgi:hypothetical protein
MLIACAEDRPAARENGGTALDALLAGLRPR